MRLTLAALILLALLPAALRAQGPESTYEAKILSDDVYIRSGPSRNHYPTGKLRPGDRVTVHRHEPGGWLMISPPPGSFDWIAADNVQLVQQPTANSPARGTVRVNQAVVRIGSGIEENSREYWHVSLSRGKSVTILGEKIFDTPQGPKRWYKIAPPAGDHRWILGQFVDRIGNGANNADPFDNQNQDRDLPAPDRRQKRQRKRAQQMLTEQEERFSDYDLDAETEGGLKERKLVRIDEPAQISDKAGSVRTGPSQEELQDDRARISNLDARFREILRRETEQWDFTALEQDYKNLQRSAAHDAIGRQINLRLRKVAQYKKVKAEHDEFIRLTKESDEREARILSMRSQAAAPAHDSCEEALFRRGHHSTFRRRSPRRACARIGGSQWTSTRLSTSRPRHQSRPLSRLGHGHQRPPHAPPGMEHRSHPG